jgi:hypothetical protein
MSLFLGCDNNLSDLEDICEARKNLGFGDIVYFDVDNVIITGGTISVNSLKFKTPPSSNSFLKCSSNDGHVYFADTFLPNWVLTPSNLIPLSGFSNDLYSMNPSKQLHKVAYSGLYTDLENSSDIFKYSSYTNDIQLLNVNSNLRDLNNIDEARSNLGIGNAALLNSNDSIVFNNLIVSNLYIKHTTPYTHTNPLYMYVDADGKATPKQLVNATTSTYGVVLISDSLNESENTNIHTVPSYSVVKKALDDLDVRFTNVETLNPITSSLIDVLIVDSNLLKISENLNNLTNFVTARSNLGFHYLEDLITQMENGVIVLSNLHISSNIYMSGGLLIHYLPNEQNILTIDNKNCVSLGPVPKASINEFGTVKLSDELSDADDIGVTLSKSAFTTYANQVERRLNILSNEYIPNFIREMYSPYMKVSDNILVENKSIARTNIGLSALAYNGEYSELNNRPTSLSDFSNNDLYIEISNNLSEFFQNPSGVRSNLNIGSIASYDSNNVLFLGGKGSFEFLTVTQSLRFGNEAGGLHKYLCSISENGDCGWKNLPNATETTKGIVRLTSSYEDSSTHTASSSAALFKVYHELLGEIANINRRIERLVRLSPP